MSIFDVFSYYVKIARPYEYVVNSSQIKGRVPLKTTKMHDKKLGKTQRENDAEKARILGRFGVDFGSHMAPFWDPKCVEKSNENLEAFLEGKKGVKMLRGESVNRRGCYWGAQT